MTSWLSSKFLVDIVKIWTLSFQRKLSYLGSHEVESRVALADEHFASLDSNFQVFLNPKRLSDHSSLFKLQQTLTFRRKFNFSTVDFDHQNVNGYRCFNIQFRQFLDAQEFNSINFLAFQNSDRFLNVPKFNSIDIHVPVFFDFIEERSSSVRVALQISSD